MNGILVTIAILEGTVAIMVSILACRSLRGGGNSGYLLASFVSNKEMISPSRPSALVTQFFKININHLTSPQNLYFPQFQEVTGKEGSLLICC